MDIVSQRITNTLFLDRVARAVLGKATSGVSVGGSASRIHLLDGKRGEPSPQQRHIQSL